MIAFQELARYQAVEFRSDMLRLGMEAMMGSEAEAIAQATADVVIGCARDPDATGVAERYRAACEATILPCFVKPAVPNHSNATDPGNPAETATHIDPAA